MEFAWRFFVQFDAWQSFKVLTEGELQTELFLTFFFTTKTMEMLWRCWHIGQSILCTVRPIMSIDLKPT